MGSDFSALDAELDTLGPAPTVETWQLARTYAGTASIDSSADAPATLLLTEIDDALAELDGAVQALSSKRVAERAERAERVRRSTTPPPLPSRRAESQRAQARAVEQPSSEEMVLPEPVLDEPARGEQGSGELPLQAAASRSGSFSLEHVQRRVRSPGHDDTVEPFDDELVESDVDLVEFSSAAPGRSPSAGPQDTLVNSRFDGLERERPLFDLQSPENIEAQQEADAAFAELFSEATRHSNMPSSDNSQVPEQYTDDTETFDASSLAFIEKDAASASHVSDEELDSAEFEIVMDADGDGAREKAPSLPPREAEKRPSFLGRLFGRKED